MRSVENQTPDNLTIDTHVSAQNDALLDAFKFLDGIRCASGNALDLLGYRSQEARYRVVASAHHWRLREYAGPKAWPSVLIVAAPIKRPYIWDLTPSRSAVQLCLKHGLQVYLLEWIPPRGDDGSAGLNEYASEAISEATAIIARAALSGKPFIIGHSLGGTLAAMFCAMSHSSAKGLILLSAPLCFRPGVSRFGDAIASMDLPAISARELVPGSLLSQMSTLASPGTFFWSRLSDALLKMADPCAMDVLIRIERWALEEVPLPARLVRQILERLYREDRFCKGTLRLGRETVGPTTLNIPTLAVVNSADEISPAASVAPFLRAVPNDDVSLIEFPGETGAGLQHLAVLTGRNVHAQVWPQLIDWMRERQ